MMESHPCVIMLNSDPTDLPEQVTGSDAVTEALRNDLILIEIFGHASTLDPCDLLRCRLVNLKWYQICSSLVKKLDLFQLNLVYDKSIQEYTKVIPKLRGQSSSSSSSPKKLLLPDLTLLLNSTPAHLFPFMTLVLDPGHLDTMSMQNFLATHGHQVKDLTLVAWESEDGGDENISEMTDTTLRRILFEGQCPNIEKLSVEKFPRCPSKFFNFKENLPKLRTLDVENYEDEMDDNEDPSGQYDHHDLWHELLLSATNIEVIDLGSTTLLPAVVRAGRAGAVKTVPFEPSEWDIEIFENLAANSSLRVILAINFCGVCHDPVTLFPRAVHSLNKLFAKSRHTLTSIMYCQPLNFLANSIQDGGCGVKIEIPICPNLRHFECFVSHVHEMTGARDFKMFPQGFCPATNFPCLRDIELNLTESGNRSTWDDYFPKNEEQKEAGNEIVSNGGNGGNAKIQKDFFTMPNVLSLDGHFLLSQFPPQQLTHWSEMCPKLRILSIFSFNVDELAEGLTILWLLFPQILILNVGVYVYKMHLVQSLTTLSPNFSLAAAVDAAVTGLSEQKCTELLQNFVEQQQENAKDLVRENRPSLLDMNELKYLTFNFETDDDDDWNDIEDNEIGTQDEAVGDAEGGHRHGDGWKKVKIMSEVTGLYGFDQVPNLTVSVTAVKRHSGASPACKENLKDCLVAVQKYMTVL